MDIVDFIIASVSETQREKLKAWLDLKTTIPSGGFDSGLFVALLEDI